MLINFFIKFTHKINCFRKLILVKQKILQIFGSDLVLKIKTKENEITFTNIIL